MTASLEVSTKHLLSVLKDDLAAVSASIEKRDPNGAVVFANRFMSNVFLFGEARNSNTLLFVGETVRLLSEDLVEAAGRLSDREGIPGDLNDVAQTYVATVGEHLPSLDVDFLTVTQAFYSFSRAIAPYQQAPPEKASYSATVELNGQVWRALGQILQSNAETILETRGNLLEGVLNEASRLVRVHSFDQKDLCFVLGMKSASLLNSYYKYLSMPFEREPAPPPFEKIRAEQSELVQSIKRFLEALDKVGEQDAWSITRDFAAPLIRRWREFFVLYMDIPRPSPPVGINITQSPAPSVGSAKKAELEGKRRPKG
jgi:hypothetical protein